MPRLACLLGSRGVLVIHRAVVDWLATVTPLGRSVHLALLFEYVVNRCASNENNEELAMSDEEMAEELASTVYTVMTCRKALAAAGLIFTTTKHYAGFPKTHYSVVWDAVNKVFTMNDGGTAATDESEAMPSTFREWVDLITKEGGSPVRSLHLMFRILYPGVLPPTHGHVGAAMKQVGGPVVLAEALWRNSTRPVVGNPLSYAVASTKRTRQQRGGPNYQEGF